MTHLGQPFPNPSLLVSCTPLRIPPPVPSWPVHLPSVLTSLPVSAQCRPFHQVFCDAAGLTPQLPHLNSCGLLPTRLSAQGKCDAACRPSASVREHAIITSTVTGDSVLCAKSLVQPLNVKSLEGPHPIHRYFPVALKTC